MIWHASELLWQDPMFLQIIYHSRSLSIWVSYLWCEDPNYFLFLELRCVFKFQLMLVTVAGILPKRDDPSMPQTFDVTSELASEGDKTLLQTFNSSIAVLIRANPICCLPSRCASTRLWVSPITRNDPQTSQSSIFSWKSLLSSSNPAKTYKIKYHWIIYIKML